MMKMIKKMDAHFLMTNILKPLVDSIGWEADRRKAGRKDTGEGGHQLCGKRKFTF
jgi:hypothetical protein